jgi:hypothetical protein
MEAVMNDQDERKQAEEALAMVNAHQERTRQAARVPWWIYVVMFVASAGVSALNDFISLTGSKLIAVLILIALAVVFATSSADQSVLGRVRGVQRRQSFVPWVFGLVAFIGGLGAWLISRYGTSVTNDLADAAGLHSYPNTVTGVLYGVAFTALFALSQLLVTVSQRQTGR